MATDLQIAVRRVASLNPATSEVLREFDCADEAEVCSAVARARDAQLTWDGLGVRRRIALLKNFQRLLHERKSAIAKLITQEAGKPYVEALTTEVLLVLDAVRFHVQNAEKFLRDEPVQHGNLAMKQKAGRIIREPHGVIGIISPWNYPFSIPATESLAALVAGNAVIVKPSEFTSLVALALADLLHDAGVPKDIVQVIPGDGTTGAALLSSQIDKLVFTGSVSTGKRIARTAAERLLPVILELGGKDPMLVLEDADIDVASSGAVWGAFMNAGQACLSIERCYVHHTIYESFLDACVRKTKQLHVGNGMDPNSDVGPMIHERQIQIVEQQVEGARTRRARILTGGTRLSARRTRLAADRQEHVQRRRSHSRRDDHDRRARQPGRRRRARAQHARARHPRRPHAGSALHDERDVIRVPRPRRAARDVEAARPARGDGDGERRALLLWNQ